MNKKSRPLPESDTKLILSVLKTLGINLGNLKAELKADNANLKADFDSRFRRMESRLEDLERTNRAGYSQNPTGILIVHSEHGLCLAPSIAEYL